MLPFKIEGENDTFYLYSWKSKVDYSCGYKYPGDHEFLVECVFDADTEADARAKMLIYLIENNLITP